MRFESRIFFYILLAKSEVEDYSNGTIHILYKIIHPALQLAVDDGIIRKNPADGCMKDYPKEYEVKYALSLEREVEFLQRILLRTKIKRFYPFYAILLYSGMRISEALGLTWKDVNMDEGTISINHQLQYRRIDGVTQWYSIDKKRGDKSGKTKTKSGERILPVSPKLQEMFVQQRKEWFKINKDTSFEADGYWDFIFLSHMTGRPLHPSNVRRMLNRLEEMNDEREVQLPHITPHILRHTTCAKLAEAGIDIKIIQYLMGHSDIKTTIRVYNHTDQERARRELEKYNQW